MGSNRIELVRPIGSEATAYVSIDVPEADAIRHADREQSPVRGEVPNT